MRHAPAKSVESALALLAPLRPWDKLVSGTRAARAGDAFAVMPWAEVTLPAKHLSAFKARTSTAGLRVFKSSLEGCPYYALWPVTASTGTLLETTLRMLVPVMTRGSPAVPRVCRSSIGESDRGGCSRPALPRGIRPPSELSSRVLMRVPL